MSINNIHLHSCLNIKTESQKSPVATSQQADAITPPFFYVKYVSLGVNNSCHKALLR